jgi:hypothetical protein
VVGTVSRHIFERRVNDKAPAEEVLTQPCHGFDTGAGETSPGEELEHMAVGTAYVQEGRSRRPGLPVSIQQSSHLREKPTALVLPDNSLGLICMRCKVEMRMEVEPICEHAPEGVAKGTFAYVGRDVANRQTERK